jgi:hypothetical protein
MYFDPEKGNPPTVIMDKEGMPIQLEFGRAQAKLQRQVDAHFKNRDAARSQRDAGAMKSAPVTYTPGGGGSLPSSVIGVPPTAPFKYNVDLRDVAPPEAQGRILGGPANNWPGVARAVAAEFGLRPDHVATVISYETGGKFDPDIWGGKDNNHFGLIQFGAPEREKHLKPLLGGKRYEDATPQQWAQAIGGFLRERGFKPGMNIYDLYSTINAGAPGRYGASDNGGKDNVRSHVQRMLREHLPQAKRWLSRG